MCHGMSCIHWQAITNTNDRELIFSLHLKSTHPSTALFEVAKNTMTNYCQVIPVTHMFFMIVMARVLCWYCLVFCVVYHIFCFCHISQCVCFSKLYVALYFTFTSVLREPKILLFILMIYRTSITTIRDSILIIMDHC